MKFINKIYLLSVILLACNIAIGQQTSNDTIPVDPNDIPVLPGDEVEVLKDFKARLAETQMIKILPELPVQTFKSIPYYYEVNVRGLSLDYLPPVIRPVALPKEKDKPAYNSMIQFAYGYPRLSQAKADILYTVSDRLGIGLRYDHLAAKHKERTPASFYRHDGKVYAEYNLNNNIQLDAEALVSLDRHYLVDRIDNTADDKRDTRLYGINMGIKHPHISESTFDYNFTIGYTGMIIDFLDHEDTDSHFYTDLYAEKRLGPVGIGLGFNYNYAYFDEESTSSIDTVLSYNGVGLSPKISYNTELWNVSAGMDLLWENGDANYLPQVEIMYAVAGSKIHAGVFAKTDIRLNTLTNIQSYNPYFGRIDEILNEKTQKYGVRLAGNFDLYEFAAELGYKSSKDLLSYREANTDNDTYENIRWDGVQVNANTIFVDINASYKLTSNAKLIAQLSYQNYQDSLDQSVAGLYDLKWKVASEFTLLEDKLTVSPSFEMLMNIERGYEYDHNSINDLSLDIDYRVHENASVYLKTYNLLNNQNERWAGYKALGIGVAGGVTLRF